MIPKYLYHYTNIDSFEKIYKNRTILFNRLDLLNDPYEGVAKGSTGLKFDAQRKLVYCSCWTADEQEKIEMWGVYNRFRGVRIKMLSRMFSNQFTLTELKEGFIPVQKLKNSIETRDRNYYTNDIIKIEQVYGPYSVKYVSGVEDTFDDVVLSAEQSHIPIPRNKVNIRIAELGNKKVDYWKYEQEWRYKISAYSDIIAKPESLAIVEDVEEKEERILVPYEGEILEVLLAPCVEESTKQRLHDILGEKYDTLVRESNIKVARK